MKRIYKYVLSDALEQKIPMHRFAKILCMQKQNGFKTIWAMVDPSEEIILRTFMIYGTGWDINPNDNGGLEYIGTVQENGLVWHIFEKT